MKKLIALVALALPAFAQSTVKDALVKHWKVTQEFTLAVAKLMPADSFGFKPVPEELSFSQVLLQVGAANMGACAAASGTKRPTVPQVIADGANGKSNVDKETTLQFLNESFSFCNDAIASITPGKLDALVGPESQDDRLRMALGVLHAHRPPSWTAGSLFTPQRYQTA